MRKASTWLLEQEDSSAVPCSRPHPRSIPTENLHWKWYNERGHFIPNHVPRLLFFWILPRT